jgi:hypothetical protein
MLHTRNMWFNSMWYNNHMWCNSVWYIIICYVTGALYNVLCVLFTPLAAIFRGSNVPAAQEPPASLSLGLAWMYITWLLWAYGQTGYSYMVAFCIAAATFKLQLRVDDWETWSRWLASQSKRPGMGVLCPHAMMGCMQNFARPRGETLARADLQAYDYHCLQVALISVKSPSQRIGQSHSQRSWELRINSWEHFKLGQELSFEKWILAINELFLPK